MIPEIKHQLHTYTVNNRSEQIKIDLELDKLYNTCTGINVILTDSNAKFSTFHLDINNREVFPEKWEVLRIKFREEAPFGFDYQELNVPAAGSKVKGLYTDVEMNTNYPYTITISFRLENLNT